MEVVTTDNLDLMVRRRRAGVNQDVLARALGVDQSQLSRFETKGQPWPQLADNHRQAYLDALERVVRERAS